MQMIDESSSGAITKEELQKTLVTVADNNEINLDVDAIVQLLFKDHNSLSRGQIRQGLNEIEVDSSSLLELPSNSSLEYFELPSRSSFEPIQD